MDEKLILNRYGGKVAYLTLQGHESFYAIIRDEWQYALIVDTCGHDCHYIGRTTEREFTYWLDCRDKYIAKGVIRSIEPTGIEIEDVFEERPKDESATRVFDDEPF